MKQIVLDLSVGETKIVDVPEPVLRPGGVIVRNAYSVISVGTESTLVKFAKKNVIGKARERPDLFKAFLDKAQRDGFLTAFEQAQRRLKKYLPLGYSSSGIVVAVADDVTEFKVGDKVACAGAEYAWHAEKIFVPKNLLARIPDNVDLKDASFATISSIALNGIRCISPEIGQTIVIIGLGLLGLLALQIAKSSGCRVIGIDVDERKTVIAKQLGVDLVLVRSDENEHAVLKFTDGGADAVIITASTDSNDPVEFAGKVARNRAKISIIGAVGLDIPREQYYKKELSVVIPKSYGPGRYDRNYEEMGHDYPIDFVRWTISRNMQAVLNLMNEKKLLPSKLITNTISIDSAQEAYTKFEDASSLRIGVIIKYEEKEREESPKAIHIQAGEPKEGTIRCALIGAGMYATSVAIPLISKTKDLSLTAISTASGLNAKSAADKYRISKIYSDYHDLLDDSAIDLVFIMTRNSSHAPITLDAIKKGKNVFLEKPLAITIDEINEVEKAWKESRKLIMVGFNRRYAPFTQELRSFFKNRINPMVASYRVNAEEIPKDHWTYDKKEGGGRIVSEGCHFIDYLSYIIQSNPVKVFTNTISSDKKHDILDNFVINITFEDGSVGSVIYSSHGSKRFSKERAEFFADNKTAVIDNFRTLKLSANNKTTTKKNFLSQDKGHKNEFEFLIQNIKKGERIEDEFKMALLSSRATIAALRSVTSGIPEQVV